MRSITVQVVFASYSLISVRAAEASEVTTKAPQTVVYRAARLRLATASKAEQGGQP